MFLSIPPYALYASAASFVVGIHLFTMKLISFTKTTSHQSIFLFVTIIALLLSRWLIYKAMSLTTNPTLVHIILNFSIFITFFASVLILKLTHFDHIQFFIGIILIFSGLVFVQNSYST